MAMTGNERTRKRRRRLAREKNIRTFGVDLATLPSVDDVLSAMRLTPEEESSFLRGGKLVTTGRSDVPGAGG